ncbi:hypothetical protein [Aporhodopirellula rubra]
MVAPAVALQKLIVHVSPIPPSYFGPPTNPMNELARLLSFFILL